MEGGGGLIAVNDGGDGVCVWVGGGPFVEITIVAGSPRAAHRCPSEAGSCPARGEGIRRVRGLEG